MTIASSTPARTLTSTADTSVPGWEPATRPCQAVRTCLRLLSDLQPLPVALMAVLVTAGWWNEVSRIGECTSCNGRVIGSGRLSGRDGIDDLSSSLNRSTLYGEPVPFIRKAVGAVCATRGTGRAPAIAFRSRLGQLAPSEVVFCSPQSLVTL